MNYKQIRHALQHKFIIVPWMEAEKSIQMIEAHGRDVSIVLGAIDPDKKIQNLLQDTHFENFKDCKNEKDKHAPKIEQVQNIITKSIDKEHNDIIMFCCSGAYGRSPALAILHLMKRDNINIIDAEKIVREQKPLCMPNNIILSFANKII